MSTIIKELGHVGRTVELFKIDCEGCEWKTFPGWFGDLKIRQINVELHPQGRPTGESLDTSANRFFKYLHQKGYVIHHKESNTYGCQGICIEYALVLLKPGIFQDASHCSDGKAL